MSKHNKQVLNCILDSLEMVGAGKGSSRDGFYWALIFSNRFIVLLPGFSPGKIQDCISDLKAKGDIKTANYEAGKEEENYYTVPEKYKKLEV